MRPVSFASVTICNNNQYHTVALNCVFDLTFFPVSKSGMKHLKNTKQLSPCFVFLNVYLFSFLNCLLILTYANIIENRQKIHTTCLLHLHIEVKLNIHLTKHKLPITASSLGLTVSKCQETVFYLLTTKISSKINFQMSGQTLLNI